MEQRYEVKVASEAQDLDSLIAAFDEDMEELDENGLDECDWLDDYDPPKQCRLDDPGCESCQ